MYSPGLNRKGTEPLPWTIAMPEQWIHLAVRPAMDAVQVHEHCDACEELLRQYCMTCAVRVKYLMKFGAVLAQGDSDMTMSFMTPDCVAVFINSKYGCLSSSQSNTLYPPQDHYLCRLHHNKLARKFDSNRNEDPGNSSLPSVSDQAQQQSCILLNPRNLQRLRSYKTPIKMCRALTKFSCGSESLSRSYRC